MADFNFKQNETNVTKYEYVKFIKSTPKNPLDFHDMENILRHRQTSIVKEMYGNCRVGNSAEETFSFVGTSPKSLQIRNGVWYIDGYRIFIDTTVPLTLYSTGYIVAKIKFEEIIYTVDPSIAMKDANTNKLIETSSRIKLVCDLSFEESVVDDPDYEATVGLLKIESVLSLNPTIIEQFVFINIKFAEAINIVNKAVHTQDDDKTVLIKKLTTSIAEDGLPRVCIEDSTNSKSISLFRNQNIDSSMGAFELISVQGRWYPTLWMKSDLDEYPLCYITPDLIKLDDGNGSSIELTYDQMSAGTSLSYFSAGTFGATYKYLNHLGFEVYPYFSNGTYKYTSVGVDTLNTTALVATGDSSYNNWYYITVGGTNSKLVYQFTVASANKPTDGYLFVNHKIKSDNKRYSRIITARIYTAVGEIQNTIGVKRYELFGNSDSTIEPLKIYIGDIKVDTTFKIEYTVTLSENEIFEQNFNTYIGILVLNETSQAYPVFWYVFNENDIIFSTYVDVLRIGDHLLYIDKDSRVKVKKLITNNYSQELAEFKNNDPSISGDYTETGGRQINISNLNVETFESTWGGAKPYFDIANSKLMLPKLSKETASSTEIPVLPTLEYMSNIWATINNTSNNLQPFLPQDVYYVSTNWSKYGGEANNSPEIKPFYRSLDSALNAIKTSSTKSGTIVLYPGQYHIEGQGTDGVYDISGCSVSIVSTNPSSAFIVGGFSDLTAYSSLFIDVAMKSGMNSKIGSFFLQPFVSFSQTASKVRIGKNCELIHTDNYALPKLINITGTSSFEFYGSINYNRSVWELTNGMITNTSYLIYIKDKVTNGALKNVIIDGTIVSNNRYHAIYVETMISGAKVYIGGNISMSNRHIIATSGTDYTTANNTESTKHAPAIHLITNGYSSIIDLKANIYTQSYSNFITIKQNQTASAGYSSFFNIKNLISNKFVYIDGFPSTGNSLYGPRSVGGHFIQIEFSKGVVESIIDTDSHYGTLFLGQNANVVFKGIINSRAGQFYNAPTGQLCGVIYTGSSSSVLYIENSTIDQNPIDESVSDLSLTEGEWQNACAIVAQSARVRISNSTIKGIIPIVIDSSDKLYLTHSRIVLRYMHPLYYSIRHITSGSNTLLNYNSIHSTANKMTEAQIVNANKVELNSNDLNYFLANGIINE